LLITAVVLVTTYSLVGLVAVWGGLGRGHWFLRVAAVLLFLSVWLAAPDYRFWVAFLVQSAIVLVTLLGLNSIRAPAAPAPDAASPSAPRGRVRPKFSLSDLFLVMAAAGVALAILARVSTSMRSQWLAAVVHGVVFGALTLTAVGAADRGRRAWLRIATLLVIFPASLMGGWLWLARSARGVLGRVATVAILLLICAPPAAFYYWLVSPRFIVLAAPPADNGMDDLLSAAKMVSNPAVNVDALSGAALRAYLERDRAALKLARAGLARSCQMRLPADDSAFRQTNLDRSTMLRQLGRVFVAEGRLQREAGRPEEAAHCCFDAVQLGEAMMHGGTMLDAVVGVAIQGRSLEELGGLLPRLDAAACQNLGARLAELDAPENTFDQIGARESQYIKKTTPWGIRWTLLQMPQLWEQSRQASANSFDRGRARLRLFRCHLALRRFFLAEGAYPESLGEVAPRFLVELPLDPCSGRSLVYRKLPVGYQLYSVGCDGRDDGGRPAPSASPQSAPGDIVLDVGLALGDEPLQMEHVEPKP